MNSKIYFKVTAIIFLIIALLHLFRIIYGIEAIFGGWNVPLHFSWIGFVVASFLSYFGFKLLKM